MKPLIITTGEPAGIGPDVAISLGLSDEPVVVAGDLNLLEERAERLGAPVTLIPYRLGQPIDYKPNVLHVLDVKTSKKVIPGELNVDNAAYVIEMLNQAIDGCLTGAFSGLVTGPVQKSIINQAGIKFSGHTELISSKCNAEVVMMLASKKMRVALVTTHMPISEVSKAITPKKLKGVLSIVHNSLKNDFGLDSPTIFVAGLNPHAGEGGYIGKEEIEIIKPVIDECLSEGMNIKGPMSADTMFCQEPKTTPDAYVAMYHDQGLPVLKYSSFGQAINITLGLPIIRTSVDHGTALQLAATGHANSTSMHEAVKIAKFMAMHRLKTCKI